MKGATSIDLCSIVRLFKVCTSTLLFGRVNIMQILHMHVHVPVISLTCIISVHSGNMHVVKLDSSANK